MKESGKCPKCGSDNIMNFRKYAGFRYWCKGCGFVEIYAPLGTVKGVGAVWVVTIIGFIGAMFWMINSTGI